MGKCCSFARRGSCRTRTLPFWVMTKADDKKILRRIVRERATHDNVYHLKEAAKWPEHNVNKNRAKHASRRPSMPNSYC